MTRKCQTAYSGKAHTQWNRRKLLHFSLTFAALFTLLASTPNLPNIRVPWKTLAKIEGQSNSAEVLAYQMSHLPPLFQSCLVATNVTSTGTALTDQSPKKAPFVLVQSSGIHSVRDDFDYASSIMRCYAKHHGGIYHANIFDEKRFSQHLFTSRWITLRDRYWEAGEWLIAADGDVVPIGFHRNVMDILNGLDGGVDVVLHNRIDGEVHASVVAFRTSSKFARCFLEEWIRWGDAAGPNFDNGDLLELTLQVLDPLLWQECTGMRGLDYRGRFISCFARIYERIVQGLVPRTPLRILFPFEGFVREFMENGPTHVCYGCDVFGHSFKGIGRFFFEPYFDSCLQLPSRPLLDACYRHHIEVSSQATLQLARKHCLWHYPACVAPATRSSAPKNICYADPRCDGQPGDWRLFNPLGTFPEN